MRHQPTRDRRRGEVLSAVICPYRQRPLASNCELIKGAVRLSRQSRFSEADAHRINFSSNKGDDVGAVEREPLYCPRS